MTNRASQSHADAIECHRKVYLAIQQQEPEAARSAARDMIALARRDMERALSGTGV